MVLGFNSKKCLNHLWDLYQNLSHFPMTDLLLHKSGLLGCFPVAKFGCISLICNALSVILDKMAYFVTVVMMKLILIRRSTSYSGASNFRVGMTSASSTIVKVCLTSPVALISI